MEINCSIDFMMDCINRIHASDRWFSSSSMRETCDVVKDIMENLDMTEIEIWDCPADGKTDYGGWLMPLSWDVEEATLEVVSPVIKEPLLCRYTDVPCSLMLNSRPAEITAALISESLVEQMDINGKFILAESFPRLENTIKWFKRGAVGVISSVPASGELKNDSRQWYNYTLPHWPADLNPVGFSLTRKQGEELTSLLDNSTEVMLKAEVNSRLYKDRLPLVTGLLPGRTKDEIVITGHLFEQGANDNASGIAAALAIVKALKKTPLQRSIRLLFTYEARSLQAWLNSTDSWRNIKAGINLDMVGVSGNKLITIGTNSPVFPNYAPALLESLIEKYPDYTFKESNFGVMDNALGDPLVGIPLPYILLGDDPDYHKSSDTPESIDTQVLSTISSIVAQYIVFLGTAGYKEFVEMAELVYKTESARLCRNEGNREFALYMAGQALDSVKKIITEDDEKQDADSLISSFQKQLKQRFGEKAVTDDVMLEINKFSGLVPLKLFKGFFSFEKYLARREYFPEIKDLIHGWNADNWVNYALMWSDGKRTVIDIYNLLKAGCRFEGSPRKLLDLFDFMVREGYLSWVIRT